MTKSANEQTKDIAVTERQALAIAAGLVLLQREAADGKLRFNDNDPEGNDLANILTSGGDLQPLLEEEMEDLMDSFASLHPVGTPTPGR